MKLLLTLKSLFRKALLVPRSMSVMFKIFPNFVVSVSDQRVSADQIQHFLDANASSVGATPIASYVDWVERNEKSGLFDSYPQESEYAWIRTYASKVDRMHMVASFLHATRNIAGDIAEFGVYKGHTAILLNNIRKQWNYEKKLYLFDSFEGLPDEIGKEDDFVAGQFSDTSVEKVRQVIKGGDDVHIVKGFFSQTLPTLPDLRFSFCHIDCDLELAVIECLEYIVPRLSAGGIIVFDDYGFRACVGLRKAVDAFFTGRGKTIVSLPTSQAVYINL